LRVKEQTIQQAFRVHDDNDDDDDDCYECRLKALTETWSCKSLSIIFFRLRKLVSAPG